MLLALPAFRLAEMRVTCESKPISLSMLAGIQYAPVASVVLGFRREDVEHPLDGFGALNPEVEQLNSLGTIFSSSLFPNRAPLGQVLLTSYVGGLRAPHLVSKTPDELCKLVMADLKPCLVSTANRLTDTSSFIAGLFPNTTSAMTASSRS